MGKLIDGTWTDEAAAALTDGDGRFRRVDSVLRNWVTADGAAGPSGEGGFPAGPGRYHLYVAINCPWAHRTWIMRRLKGLEDVVSMSIAAPRRTEEGWVFEAGAGRFADVLLAKDTLHAVYTAGDPRYTGRATVPVLWDKERAVIVSNESAEIIRMFNAAFAAFAANDTDYYPADRRAEIDAVNERVYATVNNGVYRAGFARTQAAYDEAVDALFATLDWLEARLATTRYLVGDTATEAD